MIASFSWNIIVLKNIIWNVVVPTPKCWVLVWDAKLENRAR